MNLTRIVLLISAPIYAGIGVAFLIAPSTMASFVDVMLHSVTADNDIRAVYGGVNIGLGVFFAISATRPAWYQPALFVVILTLGGLAGARFLSWAVAGMPSAIGFALHASEVLGLMLSAIALRSLSKETA